MRRILLWAVLALLPLIVTVVGGAAPDSWNLPIADKGPLIEFLTTWWWLLIGVPGVAAYLYFLGHALRSVGQAGGKRVLWVGSILVLGPLVAPLYWWRFSDAS